MLVQRERFEALGSVVTITWVLRSGQVPGVATWVRLGLLGSGFWVLGVRGVCLIPNGLKVCSCVSDFDGLFLMVDGLFLMVFLISERMKLFFGAGSSQVPCRTTDCTPLGSVCSVAIEKKVERCRRWNQDQ